MGFRFDIAKGYNVILFFVHSLGGKAEFARLFLLLYLADLTHLARYGSLISGDNYIAMKYGPAPFHILNILHEEHEKDTGQLRQNHNIAINEHKQVVAFNKYNSLLLSDSEVECIFKVIHQYKDATFETISDIARDKAWNNADINGEIHIADMAEASGATSEMIRYILSSYNDELNSFDEPGAKK